MTIPLPLPEVQRWVGATVSKPVSWLKSENQKLPILIFLYFHMAMRNELDELHQLAIAFATGHSVDILPLFKQYRFLRSVYKHHFSAEDHVIFPALDIRVKNVAPTYSLEHEGESNLFDQLFELLNSYNMKYDEFPDGVSVVYRGSADFAQ